MWGNLVCGLNIWPRVGVWNEEELGVCGVGLFGKGRAQLARGSYNRAGSTDFAPWRGGSGVMVWAIDPGGSEWWPDGCLVSEWDEPDMQLRAFWISFILLSDCLAALIVWAAR